MIARTEVVGLSNMKLVIEAVAKKKESEEIKKDLEVLKAEIQKRGLEVLEDRNIKYYEFYGGENNTAAVTESQKLDILNYSRLKELLGESLATERIKTDTSIKYKVDSKLQKALIAIFTGDYSMEYSLEEFLDNMSVTIDGKQKKLLLKKLKGDYKKDRETLKSVLQVNEFDLDTELYYIYKIKNWELIKAFLNEEDIDHMMQEIKKCLIVEESLSIGFGYEEEEA